MADKVKPSQTMAQNVCTAIRLAGGRTLRVIRRPRSRMSALLSGLIASSLATLAQTSHALDTSALPTQGSIKVGSGSISQAGSQLTVQQNSPRLGLDWQTFNIGAGATVNFRQPGRDAVALNRVVGHSGSEIFGKLNANGQVFLVNPNGVLFAPGAKVDVGGLVASTLDVSQDDFAKGRYRFVGVGGSVFNQGRLTAAPGGYIALLGNQVTNEASIDVATGSVLLAAGNAVTVDITGSGLISAVVNQGAAKASITNSGTIASPGGSIRLDAKSAEAVASSLVNTSGTLAAHSIVEKGGEIWLSADTVTNLGDVLSSASSAQGNGGAIHITGTTVALGGNVRADGANGGTVSVQAGRSLSLADNVSATGTGGVGGSIRYQSGGQLIENNGSRSDVSGMSAGGSISAAARGTLMTSGQYQANATDGAGGRIDLTADDLRLLSTQLSATGTTTGGLVRLGGAFQGGAPAAADHATADASPASATPAQRQTFVTRWQTDAQTLPGLGNATQTFVNDGSRINVSASAGVGGTAIVWSEKQTTQLGHINAQGSTQGGSIEVSSKDTLRHVALPNLQAGSGGTVLLDPKNIVIGSAADSSTWSYAGVLSQASYGPVIDVFMAPNVGAEYFGSSVALNATGDRLAVGATGDRSANNTIDNSGAVRLFSFTDNNFSGGTLQATIGKGYTGNKNVDVTTLDFGDNFGSSVALNAKGDRLAVGAPGDDGASNAADGSGAVRLFSFTDDSFSGGVLQATLGKGYSGSKNVDVSTQKAREFFGSSVALNATGDRLAVGALGDFSYSGAVRLFSFTDNNFSGGELQATLGRGYTGGNNMDLSTLVFSDYQFGSSVALNAKGDRLAVGAPGDFSASNAAYGSGAVHLFSFTDNNFSGGTLQATIGKGYKGNNNVDVTTLEYDDRFGSSVALNAKGDRLAVGAPGDDGASNAAYGSGAVRLFSFTDDSFSGGVLQATLGKGYSGGKDVDVSTRDFSLFGSSVAFNATGDRLAVGAPGEDVVFTLPLPSAPCTPQPECLSSALPGGNVSVPNSGSVHFFKLDPVMPTPATNVDFATGPDQTSYLTSADVASTLASGTNLSLQANNDISINDAIVVVPSGAAGQLSLQAGRAINVSANVTTGNANLLLVAGDPGAVGAHRDTGTALINVNAVLNVGTGTATLAAVGGNVQKSGAGAVQTTGTGRYLMYAEDPSTSFRGFGTYSKRYDVAYNSTSTPSYASSGNWQFFSLAPTLGVAALANQTVEYGTTLAGLGNAYRVVSGLIDGDTASTAGISGTPTFAYRGSLSSAGLPAVSSSASEQEYLSGLSSLLGYKFAWAPLFSSVTVTPKPLGVASITAANKVYDGTTAAALSFGASSGVISGDDVRITGLSGVFSDKSVGSGKTVSVSGGTLAGADAGNYQISGIAGSTTADITRKDLGVASITAANKVYDGTTAAALSFGASSGVISGDDVRITGLSGAFADKNVGTGKTVAVSGGTLAGADAGNYQISGIAGSTTADITRKDLGVASITAANKVYDGTTAAALSFGASSGVISGDDVRITGLSGAFADKNVGSGKTVSVSGGTLAGADAGNYQISGISGTTQASITPRPLTIAANTVVRLEGEADPNPFGFSVESGSLVGGETLVSAVVTAPVNTAAALAGTVVNLTPSNAVFSGGLASNYDIRYANGYLIVLPKPPSYADNNSSSGSNANLIVLIQINKEELEAARLSLGKQQTLLVSERGFVQQVPGFEVQPLNPATNMDEIIQFAASSQRLVRQTSATVIRDLERQPVIIWHPDLPEQLFRVSLAGREN